MTDNIVVHKADNADNPVKIGDLTFRDGFQSLFATRGRTEDMIPMAAKMDEVGYWACEVWGGATFDTMHRFLNEDPWERLRTLKRYFKKTPLSMLVRGQNLVGYRNYADDVVDAFIDRSAVNGIDIFRTFDALNDYRNLETVLKAVKKAGKHFQGCIAYSLTESKMGGDVYTLDYYLAKADELINMGTDSICIKDMAGLMSPYDAFDLVKALKAKTDLPIHLHTHSTSGMSSMSLLKAVEAGVDIIDTVIGPFAYRTSHVAVTPMVMALQGTNRSSGLNTCLISEIAEFFEKEVIPKYRHLMSTARVSLVDTQVLRHQIPGGMISNLISQLKEMGAMDKLEDVLKELPRVRKDLGQVPLVTPTSQIVGSQTVTNVLCDTDGKRYTNLTEQAKELLCGGYGKTPMPVSSEIQEMAVAEGCKIRDQRPASYLEPELEKDKAAIGDLAVDMDDLLVYALFPNTGETFLKWKYGKETPPESTRAISKEEAQERAALLDKAAKGEVIPAPGKGDVPVKGPNTRTYNVFVDGDYFEVAVDDINGNPMVSYVQPAAGMPVMPSGMVMPAAAPVAPRAAAPAAAPVAAPAAAPAAAAAPAGAKGSNSLLAPMPGLIVRYEVKVGDVVKAGDTIVILEAMKMENNLPAPTDGTITSIDAKDGATVAKGDLLATLG